MSNLFGRFGVHSRTMNRWTFHQLVDGDNEALTVVANSERQAESLVDVELAGGGFRKVEFTRERQ